MQVVAADVNGDGRYDLVATGAPGGTTITVALAQPNGTFNVITSTNALATSAAQPGARVVVGDFDTSGCDDLAVVGASSASVPVAQSNCDGTFNFGNQPGSSGPLAALAATAGAKVIPGQYGNAGAGTPVGLAVVGTSSSTIGVGSSVGQGFFTLANVSSTFAPIAQERGVVLVPGDFNADQQGDILATGAVSTSSVTIAFSAFSTSTNATSFTTTTSPTNFAALASQPSIHVVGGIGFVGAGGGDAGAPDAGADAGRDAGGVTDAGTTDATTTDSGASDAGAHDAAPDGAHEAGADASHAEAGVDASMGGACTVANAVDLGAPGTNVTVPNNGCLRVLSGYPSWWGTSRTMQLQNTSPGAYPAPFAWMNTCAGASGSGSFTADFQSFLLTPTSAACATLITLSGNGSGDITVRYFGQ
jgi:hypothetical protein